MSRARARASSTSSRQLEGAQGENPNLITLDAGGNDVGFFKVGSDCVGADDLVNRGCDVTRDELTARVDGIEDDLTGLYRRAADIVEPDGIVVVLTYPQLIEDPTTWPADVGASCGALHAADVETLRYASTKLNDTIMDAASSVEPRRTSWMSPRRSRATAAAARDTVDQRLHGQSKRQAVHGNLPPQRSGLCRRSRPPRGPPARALQSDASEGIVTS